MTWQPIDTAPKDRRILLWRPNHHYEWAQMVVGRWDDDQYARKPHPHWSPDTLHMEGRKNAKAIQPTHWMLPEPPA